MNLFNRFITWLAYAIKPPTKPRMHRGKILSRAHAVQLKREKANKRLHAWWRSRFPRRA